MIVVTSWDDGHPMDARLADLLERYALKGTFYLPVRNCEGHPVMSPESIRALDARGFEIASHTLDHVYLTRLDQEERLRQLIEGRQRLEDILSHQVLGFCYPGGKLDRRIRKDVAKAGFTHARTVGNLWLDPGTDPLRLPTTAQFYPHGTRTLLRNFLSGGHFVRRAPSLMALSQSEWLTGLKMLAASRAQTPAVFHLWGHSWELERLNLWQPLEDVLAHLAALAPSTMTVGELAARMKVAATEMAGV